MMRNKYYVYFYALLIIEEALRILQIVKFNLQLQEILSESKGFPLCSITQSVPINCNKLF